MSENDRKNDPAPVTRRRNGRRIHLADIRDRQRQLCRHETRRCGRPACFADVTAVTHRARVAPELTGRWAVGDSMAVWARFALGARYDRGDAETALDAEAALAQR